MAPEQLEAKEADARTDIFGLGLVLYEMTTGYRAFTGESPAALIAQIMRGEFAALRDAPPALVHVVERCLATDPANRWHAAADVRLELEWAAAIAPSSPESPAGISRRWALAAPVALLAGIGGSMAVLRRDLPESPVYRLSIAPPAGAEFYRTPNHSGLALSPDGRTLVFLAMRNGQSRLWVQGLDSISAHELTGTEEATFPFWSPDSRSLGFFAAGRLKRIDIDGSNLQVLCDIRVPRGGTWNTSDVILFAPLNSARGTLYRIAARGGEPLPVKLSGSEHLNSYRASPQFLPDGTRFLYWLGGREAGTYIGSLSDQKLNARVLPFNSWAQFAQAKGAGPEYLFWHRDDMIVAQQWDSRSFRLFGDPEPLGGPVKVLASTAEFSVTSAWPAGLLRSFRSANAMAGPEGQVSRRCGRTGLSTISPAISGRADGRCDPT